MEFKEIQHIDTITLSATGTTSVIEVLKVGKVHDRDLSITKEMLDDFVIHFEENIYGTEIQVNFSHNREGEAAGWVKRLFREGDKLLAEVEWTPIGIEKIRNKQFRFTSSELALTYVEPSAGRTVKNVFTGVALTNVPAVKGMSPVTLSEQTNLFFKFQIMKCKEMYNQLKAQEKVTKEDVANFKALAEEEKAEGVDAMVKELEAKIVVEEEVKKEEKKEEEDTPNLSEKESLMTKLNELTAMQEKQQAENLALRKKLEVIELSNKVEKELLLSETSGESIGFHDGDKTEVVSFLAELSAPQRAKFISLVKKIKAVDFSVKGGEGTEKEEETKETQLAELQTKAKELASKEGIELSDALTRVALEMNLQD